MEACLSSSSEVFSTLLAPSVFFFSQVGCFTRCLVFISDIMFNLSGQWTGLLSTVNGNFHCLQL